MNSSSKGAVVASQSSAPTVSTPLDFVQFVADYHLLTADAFAKKWPEWWREYNAYMDRFGLGSSGGAFSKIARDLLAARLRVAAGSEGEAEAPGGTNV